MSDQGIPMVDSMREAVRRIIDILGPPDISVFVPGISAMTWLDRKMLLIGSRNADEEGVKVSLNIASPGDIYSAIQDLFKDLNIEASFHKGEWVSQNESLVLTSNRKAVTTTSLLQGVSDQLQNLTMHVVRAGQDWLDLVDHQTREVNTLVHLNAKIESMNYDLHRLLIQRELRQPSPKDFKRIWRAVRSITAPQEKALLWSTCRYTGNWICYQEGARHPAGCLHMECSKEESEKVVWVESIYDALNPHQGSGEGHPDSVKTHFTTDGILSYCRNETGRRLTRVPTLVTCKMCRRKIADYQLKKEHQEKRTDLV